MFENILITVVVIGLMCFCFGMLFELWLHKTYGTVDLELEIENGILKYKLQEAQVVIKKLMEEKQWE